MQNCKPVQTPLPTKLSLLPSQSGETVDATLYRQLIGSLQYVTLTRPDLNFSINLLSQFMHQPTSLHFKLLKRVLRYLQGTKNYGLPILAGPLHLQAFCDADWAGNQLDRKSTTGFAVYLGSNLLSWSAKKQVTVARSSTEAEYRALAALTAELIWLKRLLREMTQQPPATTTVFTDSASAIALAYNPVFHARTKHIDVDCHFIREHLRRKEITLQHIMTIDQISDILTKPLPTGRHQILTHALTIGPPLVSSPGGNSRPPPAPSIPCSAPSNDSAVVSALTAPGINTKT